MNQGRKLQKQTQQSRTVDLFAGVGGSSLGAMAAGADLVAAVDVWALAARTYQENFPRVKCLQIRCEDIDLVSLKHELGGIDLVIASPECTSHTCAKGSAPRSEESKETALQVTRFARTFLPRWIVVENVVHMRRWQRYESWINELKSLGYNVSEQVLNSADFGVPQARRRLFIICDKEVIPPTIAPAVLRRRPASAIVDKNGSYPFSPLERPGRAEPTIQRAKRALNALGGGAEFLIVYYGSDAAGGWQRLDVPLRTITTLDRFAYVRPNGSGYEMRMLQVPELKMAMGFPKTYKLSFGTRREKLKLLGNAVSPPVMKAIIHELLCPPLNRKREYAKA